ncbi:hypothetical protein [Alteraurantiacibacter aquimixticola]|uniref:Uncharacterized protein n=1 Tax=Alteraurantiacibacter aquimixticola TaxID=2489173 RepID=A0A4T3F2X0_9SPHN|nr:hypothetical protein [Alteraurantiacibacter aquimixticola]TIX49775.1 hypothetical protein E5222_13270 [Alteraurantiacibacter aquimixticola]
MMVVLLFLGIAVLAAWFLVSGFRSQTMTAMGVPYGRWSLVDRPSLFWMAAIFNLLVLISGLLLLIDEVKQ